MTLSKVGGLHFKKVRRTIPQPFIPKEMMTNYYDRIGGGSDITTLESLAGLNSI